MVSENLQTIGAIYEAFGAGDVPGVLAFLSDDCAWESWQDNSSQRAGVPWFTERTGPQDIAGFFAVIGAGELHDFQVHALMEGPDRVAAEIEIDLTPAGATRYRDEEMHLWYFDADGKVCKFRHYADTAKHIAAAGVTAAL